MIKSGAVIQNRALGGNYPSSYNPHARPGNYDVVHPATLSVFDTGFPKTVSPYQPRVAVSVEIQPKSVFKPRRVSKKLSLKNGDFWGQTALKNIFGGEQNVVTNYMAQRLLGIVDPKPDDRMSESMQSQRGAFNQRQSTRRDTFTTVSSAPQPSPPSEVSSMGRKSSQSSLGLNDLFNLNLSEMVTADLSNPMVVTPLSDSATSVTTESAPLSDSATESAPLSDSATSVTTESVVPTDEEMMEAAAEVETDPLKAAEQLGIVQHTEAGPKKVSIKAKRGFGLNANNPSDSEGHSSDTFDASDPEDKNGEINAQRIAKNAFYQGIADTFEKATMKMRLTQSIPAKLKLIDAYNRAIKRRTDSFFAKYPEEEDGGRDFIDSKFKLKI